MMMDKDVDLVALSRAWRMAIAGVRVGVTGPDFFGQSWHIAEVAWLDAAGSQRIAEGRHGHSAEHAIECALSRAWLDSQPRKAGDDDDDEDDDDCTYDDCASCGGSGGGDPPMVCRSCGGSGRSRSEPSEPDYYGDEDDDGEGRGSDWGAWRAREW